MTLGALLRGAADRAPFPGAIGMDLPGTVAGGNVSAIAYDSRAVEPGAVFVALRGVHADGAQFARDAIARGALDCRGRYTRASRDRCALGAGE